MKIYTKTGDKGYTSLIGGTRVPKHHLRIDTYGTVDELNSYIGMIRDNEITPDQKAFLKEIQDRLFTIGSSLALDPEKSKMKIPDLHTSDIGLLEQQIDRMTEALPLHENIRSIAFPLKALSTARLSSLSRSP
jgi:cob(I)alamin adenosyltransferase